jgi:hypothetical protein
VEELGDVTKNKKNAKKNAKKKYVKFPKHLKKQKKMLSEQSHDKFELIISTPINSSMSDE